jgi:hypothetical protein
MHAEAVRYDATPTQLGLIRDETRPVKCGECNVKYYLHYDSEAEASITLCSILADEIVTARHPDHGSNVLLDLTTLGRRQPQKSEEVVWSIRTPLFGLLKKKPGVP